MRGNNLGEMHEGVNFLDLGYRLGQAMRKNIPETIASMTGGEYEWFATGKGFDARMIDFTNHVHSRYFLSIEPKSPHAGFHRIRVRLRNPGNSVVLARSSYWACGRGEIRAGVGRAKARARTRTKAAGRSARSIQTRSTQTRSAQAGAGLQAGNPLATLLWMQVFCQLFAASLLLIHVEFS